MEQYAQFKGHLLPSLFGDRATLATLVVGQFLAILLTFSPLHHDDPWLKFGLVSLFIHVCNLISLSLLALIKPRIKTTDLIPQLLIILFVVNIVVFAASTIVISVGLINDELVLSLYFKNALIATIISLLFVQFNVMHQQNSQTNSAYDRAQLDALQARIRPHFLFNSLNTAAELVHHDPKEAEKIILAIAALARASMNAGQSVTLANEIELAKQYLQIEKWRLGARLNVIWRLPDTLPQLHLPSLTIQPLLENAVCHGIEPLTTSGNLEIELHVTDKSVTLVVMNPLCSERINRRERNGVAINNIKQRLVLAFNHRASLTFHQGDAFYRSKLVLPRGEQ
ncbi:two-component system, LytT family, sensor histidine kinase AlgZ [Pseudoalteromonas ulvae UL12]|uniref:Signal transduction histidine kinase internal region domain-containing protein n=1 Tax=Pseudoalteromonas ulvae TaxID=107327 RepID=A0A244CUZ1_PSEDV|nr:histidine kinase [Pseudoalteromonas ulvae]MBE0362640.1 two-component system, LytT family, sensor histidine kinase AlgZ [Pseudoalteromonas ulvae UL12]OUL59408.1 hypothetical protein B1199_03825 [Pseudoalteromonas ulvae]